jgi:hypothetical protein
MVKKAGATKGGAFDTTRWNVFASATKARLDL